MYQAKKVGFYNISNQYEQHEKFLRFLMVGCINTGVDFAVFSVLYSFFDLNKLLCQVFGYSVGLVNSFIMNKVWTFEDQNTGCSIVNQSARFISVNLVSLGISLIALGILNDRLQINLYISKLIITGIAQGINYFGYKLWVFNHACSLKGANNEK
jgi:putative flippase GtrA